MNGLSKAANMIQRSIERTRDKGDLTFDLACLRAGRKFPIADRIESLGGGERAGLFIDNSSADIDYVVQSVGIKSLQLSDVTWSRGATETTPGSEIDVMNANTQSDRTFSGTVRETQTGETGDYTHGDPVYFEDIVPAGTTGNATGGSTGQITFTVPRESNALVTLTNATTNVAERASLPFVIYEVDPDFVMTERNADSYFNPRWDR